MRNEPRNNDSWEESKPDYNDVGNVEVIVVLIRFCYYLSYDSENFLKIHIPCCIVREIKKTVFFFERSSGLTLSDPEDLDTLKTRKGSDLPGGKRWPLEASEATADPTNQTNIISDIFLYL